MKPILPIEYIIILGGIMLVFSAVSGWKSSVKMTHRARVSALVCRLAALILVGLIALNIGKWIDKTDHKRKAWGILIDTSQSMQTTDADGAARWQAASAIAAELLDDEALAAKVVVYGFDEHLHKIDALSSVAPEGATTDILTSGAEMVRKFQDPGAAGAETGLKGLVLLTDGKQVAAPRDRTFALQARAAQVPVYAVLFGRETRIKDLKIQVGKPRYISFTGQKVKVYCRVKNSGLGAIAPELSILENGQRAAPPQNIKLADNSEGIVSFEIDTPEAGYREYTVSAPVWPGETEANNNSAKVNIIVLDRKIKVLFIEGVPFWDTKFLVQYLRQLPSLEVKTIYRLSPKRFYCLDTGGSTYLDESQAIFPDTIEELLQYDVIMFGKGVEFFLNPPRLALLNTYLLKHGGGIICTRGKPYSGEFAGFEKYEPCDWGEAVNNPVRFTPTSAGKALGIFGGDVPDEVSDVWAAMPLLDQAHACSRVKPFTQVLAQGHSEAAGLAREIPALMSKRFGRGMVIVCNAAGLWKWDFNRKENEGQEIYRKLWAKIVYWIATQTDFLPGAQVAMQLSQASMAPGEAVTAVVKRRSPAIEYKPCLKLSREGQIINEVNLTWYGDSREETEYSFVVEQPGHYTVTVCNRQDGQSTVQLPLFVRYPPTETTDVSADARFLEEITSESGGRVIAGNELRELLEEEEGTVRVSQEQVWASAWDSGWLLILILVFQGCEWFLRRRKGVL